MPHAHSSQDSRAGESPGAASPSLASLLAETARALGARGRDAAAIANGSAMRIRGMALTAALLPPDSTDDTGLLLLLDTRHKIDQGEPNAVASILQWGAGLLPAYRAALSASPDGHWLLARVLPGPLPDAGTLCRELATTRALADLIWSTSLAS